MINLSMTLSSASVTLADGKGSITASITNGSPTHQRVVLGAYPGEPSIGAQWATAKDWITIKDAQRTIPPGTTEQYEVSFDTTGASEGAYSVKLIPYNADEAPENYGMLGHTVQFTVAPVPLTPPPPKPSKWILIIAAAAAAVLIISGLVWFFVSQTEPEAGPAPASPTQTKLALTSVVPEEGPLAGNNVVVLRGQFREPTVVGFGSLNVTANRINDSDYSFTMPPGSQPGMIAFNVHSGGELIGAGYYTYTRPPSGGGGIDCRKTSCVPVPPVLIIPERLPIKPPSPAPGPVPDFDRFKDSFEDISKFNRRQIP